MCSRRCTSSTAPLAGVWHHQWEACSLRLCPRVPPGHRAVPSPCPSAGYATVDKAEALTAPTPVLGKLGGGQTPLMGNAKVGAGCWAGLGWQALTLWQNRRQQLQCGLDQPVLRQAAGVRSCTAHGGRCSTSTLMLLPQERLVLHAMPIHPYTVLLLPPQVEAMLGIKRKGSESMPPPPPKAARQ